MNLQLPKKIGLIALTSIPVFVNAQGDHPLFSAQIKSGESSVSQSSPLLENKMRVNRWIIPVKKGDAVLAMIKADGSGMVQYEIAAQAKVLFYEEQKYRGAGGELFYNPFNKDDTLQVSVYMSQNGYSLPFKYKYAVLSKEQLAYPVKGKFSEKLISLLAGARFCFANWFYTVNRNIKRDTTIEKGLFPNSVRTWIYASTIDHIIAENISKEAAASIMKKWVSQVDDALKDMPNIDIHHNSEQDNIAEGISDILESATYVLNTEVLCFMQDEWKPSPTAFRLMLIAEKKDSGKYTVGMYIKVQ